MRRIIAVVGAVVALTACTPREIRLWSAWHDKDPAAAEAFARQLPHPVPAVTTRWSVNWDSVAWCESGGNWHYPPVTNSSGTYSGGLMIWQRAWVAYGGRQFASWAYLASKTSQIVVAERILADNGRGAWDCL